MESYGEGTLQLKDFLKVHLKTDDGNLVCAEIAQGEETIAALRQAHPKAF